MTQEMKDQYTEQKEIFMERKRKILFIAATHGDESFSIGVLENLEKRYSRSEYGYDWIVGNPKALERGSRYIDTDLNRSAPGDPNGVSYEQRRAAKIMELSRRYTFVIDIHGTVANTGIVTIIPYPTLTNLVLASALSVERNVIWYARESLEQGPLVQFTQCPGIELECGPKSSKEIKIQLDEVLSRVLDRNTSWNLDALVDNLKRKEFYYIYDNQPDDGNTYTNFALTRNKDEEFYPFLTNQYPGISCCKMKKMRFEEIFLI